LETLILYGLSALQETMPQEKESLEKATLQGISTAMAVVSAGAGEKDFNIVAQEDIDAYLKKLPEFMCGLRDRASSNSSMMALQTGVTPPLRSMEVDE
jgi:hypothetical protein